MPSLFWLKDGSKLTSNGKTEITHYSGGTVLRISSASSQDGGIYQCFAENELGNIQTPCSVVVDQSGRCFHLFIVVNCKVLMILKDNVCSIKLSITQFIIH